MRALILKMFGITGLRKQIAELTLERDYLLSQRTTLITELFENKK